MKRIEAIIRPNRVFEVCAALTKAGHPGVTISFVEGRGNEQAWVQHVRTETYEVSLLARARVEVVARDENVDAIVNAIREAAFTGQVGDGKIFIHEMAGVIRIRTNESGMAAV